MGAALAMLPATPAHAVGWAPVPAEVVAPDVTAVVPVGLTFGPGGSLTAMWLQGSPGSDLVISDRVAGGAWSAPAVLSGGAAVTYGTLVANASGAQAAAWREGGYVRAATRAAGGAWQPVAVPLSGSGIASAPAVAIAPDGTIGVAWEDAGTVKVSVRAPGGAFSSAATIPSGTSPHDVALAAGPSSDFLLVWADTNGVQERVASAYRAPGGPSFAAPVAVVAAAPSVGTSLYLKVYELAFDPAGEATVVWFNTLTDSNTNQTYIKWQGKWRAAGAGGGYQPMLPQTLDSATLPGTNPVALPTGTMAPDASGRTTFVWPAFAGGISTALRTSGTSFGAAQNQAFTGTGTPRLISAAAGGSLIVEHYRQPAVALAPPGGALGVFDASPFTTVGTTISAALAGDAAGDAGTVWSAKDGTTYHLLWTVYDATAPEARDLSVPASATAGASTTFSVTPWDALTTASASWDFGDGTTATGASVQHGYDTPGDRAVTVTVTDAAGNTTTATRPISVAAATPGTGGGSTVVTPPLAAPVLSEVRLSRTRFAIGSAATPVTGKALAARASAKRGTDVRWKLSAAATLRFTITTVPARGRKARTAGVLRRTANSGGGRLKFSGRIGRRALKPGRYRLTIVAVDAAGRTSATVTRRFTIVRAA